MQPEKVNRYSLRKLGQHLVSAVVAVVVVGILFSGMALSQATLAHADMVGEDNDLRNGLESHHTADSENRTNPLTKDEEGYYDLMAEKTLENLYPEVFSDEELQKAEAEKDDKVKIYFTPKGKDFNPKGKDTKQLTLIGWRFVDWYPQEGTVDYFIFLPKRNVGLARAQVGAVYHAFNTLEEGNKISFNEGKYAETPFSLLVNKKVLGENLKEETKFKVNPKQTRAFVRVSYQVTKEDDALSQVFYVDRYGEGNTIFKFFVTSVDADFHFVDDSSYRKLTNQKLSSPLKERSEKDKDSFSNEPFRKLDLKDMLGIVKTDKALFGNNPVYKARLSTPLLSYQEDKSSIKRPTLDQLKAKTIPGYIYCDNDIDKPKTKEFKKDDATTKEKGNHYLTYGYDNDRNMLTTKHYYLTYRALPTEIVVRQFKEDKKTPLDNSFDLYRVEDNKEVLVKSAIKPNHSRANEKEDTINSIEKMMEKTTIDDQGYYEKNNHLYLEPGKYILKSKSLDEKYYNEKENQEFTVGLLDSSDKKTRIVVDFNAGLKHKVTYNFKSEDGKNLPDKVTNLLPKNENTYKKGEKITPADPTQKEISVDGGKWTFIGYDTEEQTVEDKDLTFTGTWKFTSIKPLSTLDEAPNLQVKDAEITVGETLNLKDLIISATDKEDGDLREKVEIVDKGGFDNNKVGTYKITYKVADSKGATATKQATVTVKEKTKSNPEPEPEQESQPKPETVPEQEQESQQEQQSQPQTESQLQSEPKTELQSDTQPQSQPQPKPETQPQHKAALPRTGTTVSSLVLMGSVLVAMGVLLQVSKRKD
ncbi:SHIRT domain-containing protein [Gardnerella piotii]|uniref:SHIRT domain-containing protein n=1 Tax=Gardnerella piotii TaxID=2792977 RepID=UPI003CE54042